MGSRSNSLALSDLFNVVRDTNGVRRVGANVEDFHLASTRVKVSGSTVVQTAGYHDLNIMPREFPRLGSVTIVDGDTGEVV